MGWWWVAPQLEDTPVTQEGFVWGSREHQNQGTSDPQVSKVLGGHCVLRGDQSPVLDIIGAQVPLQPDPKATHLQEQRPS
ncbi:hypothetical protein Cadr_000012087 [Camelus dromedarius]|uniref:Uncharacterized protein n=1 Tax=Camelus dromedarius TaxID=9838 RepID=A0A5N4DTU4_CAMDR|nr:hypothetical protein Cadr_000012087 [Camelus dromedarius]